MVFSGIKMTWHKIKFSITVRLMRILSIFQYISRKKNVFNRKSWNFEVKQKAWIFVELEIKLQNIIWTTCSNLKSPFDDSNIIPRTNLVNSFSSKKATSGEIFTHPNLLTSKKIKLKSWLRNAFCVLVYLPRVAENFAVGLRAYFSKVSKLFGCHNFL